MTTQAADFTNESTVDTILALRRTSTRALASDCYDVASAFVEQAPFWGRGELATWLLGPYSRLAQDGRDASPASRPSLRAIEKFAAERVIPEAHKRVLAAIASLEDPQTAATLAFEMISAGFVANTVDANGVPGWVPTTAAQDLADRVISLLVADFLTSVFTGAMDGDDDELPLAA